jgi:hypothetical protein
MKTILPQPGGWAVAEIPHAPPQKWMRGYKTFEEVGACYLGLLGSFKRLAEGESGMEVLHFFPAGGFPEIIRNAKEYAKENPDAPMPFMQLAGEFRRFKRLCAEVDTQDAETARRARVEAWEAYAVCWGHEGIVGEGVRAFLERVRIESKAAEDKKRAAWMRKQARAATGTERGMYIVMRTRDGLNDGQIAEELGLSRATVRRERIAASAKSPTFKKLLPPVKRGRPKRIEIDHTKPPEAAERERANRFRNPKGTGDAEE